MESPQAATLPAASHLYTGNGMMGMTEHDVNNVDGLDLFGHYNISQETALPTTLQRQNEVLANAVRNVSGPSLEHPQDTKAEQPDNEELQPQASPASTRQVAAAEALATFQTADEPVWSGLHGPAAGQWGDLGFDAGEPFVYNNLVDDGQPPIEDWRSTFEDGEQDDLEAMAKLKFPDGDYFVHHTCIRLGRDKDAHREWQKSCRSMRRQERQAETALHQYAQEPSQPSHPDDADAADEPLSSSSQSLEGRPAPGLPSNYSEPGGIVSYRGADTTQDDIDRALKRRRRNLIREYSESSNSIVPANLDATSMRNGGTYGQGALEIGEEWDEEAYFVPVHPPDLSNITSISRSHVIIRYDRNEEVWKLLVEGVRMGFNDEELTRGDIRTLEHMDTFEFAGIDITFMLPLEDDDDSIGPTSGVFADTNGSDVGTSPVRHLSNAFDDEDDDDEDVKPLASAKKRPTIKLSSTKKLKKADAADGIGEETAASKTQSPEAIKRAGKGKKRKIDKESAPPEGELPDPEIEQPMEPSQPVDLKGTGLEHVAPEDLPQRRSGPGRPPANGRVSKRDVASVNRLTKELQKRGEPLPPYADMLERVRMETKIRDAQNKAQAKGQPITDMPMQSIERDVNSLPYPRPMPPPAMVGEHSASAAPLDQVKEAPPKPSRLAKSMSPLPLLDGYSHEELQKPGITCQVQLNNILTKIGPAELPQIYHEMQKNYPYYRTTGTNGWQSSVRHNLQQFERFRAEGKNGKGKIWSIDENVPIDKERGKKRRTPPLKTPAPAMQQLPNGQWVPVQSSYPQTGLGGSSNYAGGQYPAQYAPGMQPPPGYGPYGQHQPHPNQHTQGQYAQQQAHQQPSPAAQAASALDPALQEVVLQIVSFRTEYLAGFTVDSEAYKFHEKLFTRICNEKSDQYHGLKKKDDAEAEPESTDAQERFVQGRLKVIFEAAEKKRLAEGEARKAREAASSSGGQLINGPVSVPYGSAPSPAQHQRSVGSAPHLPQSSSAAPAPQQTQVNQVANSIVPPTMTTASGQSMLSQSAATGSPSNAPTSASSITAQPLYQPPRSTTATYAAIPQQPMPHHSQSQPAGRAPPSMSIAAPPPAPYHTPGAGWPVTASTAVPTQALHQHPGAILSVTNSLPAGGSISPQTQYQPAAPISNGPSASPVAPPRAQQTVLPPTRPDSNGPMSGTSTQYQAPSLTTPTLKAAWPTSAPAAGLAREAPPGNIPTMKGPTYAVSSNTAPLTTSPHPSTAGAQQPLGLPSKTTSSVVVSAVPSPAMPAPAAVGTKRAAEGETARDTEQEAKRMKTQA
ncbi:hypothetical protein LTR62_000736 [Meristemomyces frigidus]|uniref:Fork-head domain-containing protein n=1 Tax=Meristemomyces frigidus TaxID=1508187 RepID=A0AAN7T8X5_9PEZI|nr:hypothetical protein LTR62_000736 [Meristemomyces frigidus]